MVWFSSAVFGSTRMLVCILRLPSCQLSTLWKEFGRALKLGVLDDDNNRCGIVAVLLFEAV
jgi:HSP90 family molecular chaperone